MFANICKRFLRTNGITTSKNILSVRVLHKRILLRPFSDSSLSETSSTVVYEGIQGFTKRLRWLRRVSLTSSVFSVVGLPLMIAMKMSTVALIGQYAIVGSVIMSTVSSTALLQLLTHPYVVRIHEIKNVNRVNIESRTFRAVRINVFGSFVETEFNLCDVEGNNKFVNPFASFRANKNYYYIVGSLISDVDLRKTLTSPT